MKLYYLRKLEKISTNTSSIGIIFMEIPNEYFDFHKNKGMIDIFWHSQNVEILMLSWVKERCPCPSFIYVYTGFTLKLEKLEIRKFFIQFAWLKDLSWITRTILLSRSLTDVAAYTTMQITLEDRILLSHDIHNWRLNMSIHWYQYSCIQPIQYSFNIHAFSIQEIVFRFHF